MPASQLGCNDCWARIPEDIRSRLSRADVRRDDQAWEEAVRDAADWYLQESRASRSAG